MSNISEIDEGGSEYGSEGGSEDDSEDVRTNDNPDPDGPIIHNHTLENDLQRAKSSLSFSVFIGPTLHVSKKIINSVIHGNFSWIEMKHLASTTFLRYLVINNPKLAEFLQDVMESIYICNQLDIDWYQWYDADVFSCISIFVGEEYEIHAPLPPRVDKIGALHLPYFYKNWLRYYNIYQKLSWVMYKIVVFRKLEEKKLYRKKGLKVSFKDALLENAQDAPKISCIELFFKRDHLLIASFLGTKAKDI